MMCEFDVTVTFLLNSNIVACHQAWQQRQQNCAKQCQRCVPLAVEAYGALGVEAVHVFLKLTSPPSVPIQKQITNID